MYVCGGTNRTKMFHVKHFGTIEAQFGAAKGAPRSEANSASLNTRPPSGASTEKPAPRPGIDAELRSPPRFELDYGPRSRYATACGLSPVISVMIFAPRLIRTTEDSELKGGSLSISILQQILSDCRHEEPK
jgi:hypothetical protein